MKATSLLRDQHRRLDRLLERTAQDRVSRMELVLKLVEELLTHLSIEDHFLGAVYDRAGIGVGGYRDAHARMRNAVLQAVFAESNDDMFALRLCELRTVFRQHARGLERDVLPLAESQLRAEELERMGERMLSFWSAAIGNDPTAREAQGHAAE
jgi:hypothetical protein